MLIYFDFRRMCFGYSHGDVLACDAGCQRTKRRMEQEVRD